MYMKKIKNTLFKGFAMMISFLAISTVNSACILTFGQDEEPESLKRYKKIK